MVNAHSNTDGVALESSTGVIAADGDCCCCPYSECLSGDCCNDGTSQIPRYIEAVISGVTKCVFALDCCDDDINGTYLLEHISGCCWRLFSGDIRVSLTYNSGTSKWHLVAGTDCQVSSRYEPMFAVCFDPGEDRCDDFPVTKSNQMSCSGFHNSSCDEVEDDPDGAGTDPDACIDLGCFAFECSSACWADDGSVTLTIES